MGGSIASIGTLARVLSREHTVEVWTSDHDSEYLDSAVSSVCTVRMFRLASRPFFLAPGLLPALISEGRKFDAFNVFHFWTFTGLVAGLILPRLQAPLFIHTQGIFLPVALRHHRRRKQLARLLGAPYLLSRFAVIACNPVEVPAIRKWGSPKTIHVLPNPVIPVPTERGGLRGRLGLSDDVRVVAYLNRFDPIKRVVELCRAFRVVQDRRQDTVFVLAGDAATPYGREVQAYSARSGLRAHFLGHLGPREKWSLLADADVLCQYSAQEAHSNALTEALTAGVPVVASRGCNFDEIGTEGAGFNVDSVEEMANATIRLLEDDGLRRQMSAQALQLARNYTPEAAAKTYLRIYNECRSPCIPAAGAAPPVHPESRL